MRFFQSLRHLINHVHCIFCLCVCKTLELELFYQSASGERGIIQVLLRLFNCLHIPISTAMIRRINSFGVRIAFKFELFYQTCI